MTTNPNYRTATHLVHGGVQRSQHGETAEALYLTSGYVYDDAERLRRRSPARSSTTSIRASPTRRCRCWRSDCA